MDEKWSHKNKKIKVDFILFLKTKFPTPVVGVPVRSDKLGNLGRWVRIRSALTFCGSALRQLIYLNFFVFDTWISNKKL